MGFLTKSKKIKTSNITFEMPDDDDFDQSVDRFIKNDFKNRTVSAI